jgi:hypothetical protein
MTRTRTPSHAHDTCRPGLLHACGIGPALLARPPTPRPPRPAAPARPSLPQNAQRLDREIIYDRDFDYDYFGFKTLERSYLLRIDGRVVERPQHMLMRVAVGIHKVGGGMSREGRNARGVAGRLQRL